MKHEIDCSQEISLGKNNEVDFICRLLGRNILYSCNHSAEEYSTNSCADSNSRRVF